MVATLQTGLGIIAIIVIIVGLIALQKSVVIVRPTEQKVLTELGSYKGILDDGLHFVKPFITKTFSFEIREQTIDVPQQEAITNDNSPVKADAVIYIKVMDVEKAYLEVEDYKNAVSRLAQTTLRAVIGDMELDDTLNKRQEINARIREDLAEPTNTWGVRVKSVEVREVNPSPDVQEAMEKQTAAERNRRAMILEAQGERRSAVEEAEGKRESDIIEARGQKQAQILEAQGDAVSTVLRARAANSMGERAVIDKGLEALTDIGTSESTTYVLPQELTSMLGRYGKHLSGGIEDSEGTELEALDFDSETREMLGLDNIDEIVANLEDGDVSEGRMPSEEEIKDPNEVVDNPDVEDGMPNEEGNDN